MRRFVGVSLFVVGGCVYFNAMYDARREFDAGERSLREQSELSARIQFDSVIAKTGRILEDHPDSKYADDAAILKVRSELHTKRWESAVESAALAERLAGDPATRAVAVGLGAVGRRQLGNTALADSLLGVALEGDLEADDRTLFLFNRGLARQELGRPALAAADLEAAAGEARLSPEGRLTLSIALRDVGDYGRSAEVLDQLLPEASFSTSSALYVHVDSLSDLAPGAVDGLIAGLLERPGVSASRTSVYHYLRGRASMASADTAAALAALDRAVEIAPGGVAASEAAYWAIRLRLATADTPDDVRSQPDRFRIAARSATPEVRAHAGVLQRAAREFDGLMTAYEGRGAGAAEALLRAAEVARVDLEALAVARGLYISYVRVAPGSPWSAKAVFGALSVSGHAPDPTWVEDRGEATDDELRARLSDLPADDPYRIAVLEPWLRGPAADSAYVLAEADLQRRLIEIRRLVDPTTPDTVPAAPADSTPAADRGVEF